MLIAVTTPKEGNVSDGNIDVNAILSLPEGNKQKQIYMEKASKINALMKGFYQRQMFKKMYFMHLLTGMKPD